MIEKTGPTSWIIVSLHKDPKTGKRKVLGHFSSHEAAVKRLRQIEAYKHGWKPNK
jgi:hypothetical protein